MAIDKVVSASITDSSVTSAKVASGVLQPNFRNIIINGDMNIAQRGTSATGLGNGDAGYHTVDRFAFRESGSPTYEFTQTQSTTVPTGQGFAKSLKMDCTTAQGSLAAGDNLRIDQRIEGQNLQYLKKGTSSAESLTLSFWVRSNKTGTYIVELLDDDNSRAISKSYTISSADTWEKKTITYDGDTTGAFDNDNATSVKCNFWLAAGTNYTSGSLQTSWGSLTTANRAVGQVNLADSTSNEWYITGLQLEAGTAASDFEFLPHDVNFARCQRYYFLHSNGNGDVGSMTSYYNASQLGGEIFFPCTMRTTPTITATTGTDYYTNFRSGATDGFNEIVNGKSSSHQCSWYATGGVSGSAGDSGFYRNSSSSARVEFSAEL